MVGQPVGGTGLRNRGFLVQALEQTKFGRRSVSMEPDPAFVFLQGTDCQNACIGNLWLPTPLWWADRLIQGCTLPSTICSWDRLHDPQRDNVAMKRDIWNYMFDLNPLLSRLSYKDLVTNVVVHGIFLQLQGLKCSFLHLLLQTKRRPYD